MFSEGQDRHSVLRAAAMAAKWWEPPRDALDTMVLNAAALHELEPYSHLDYMPFDPAVKARSCSLALPARLQPKGLDRPSTWPPWHCAVQCHAACVPSP